MFCSILFMYIKGQAHEISVLVFFIYVLLMVPLQIFENCIELFWEIAPFWRQWLWKPGSLDHKLLDEKKDKKVEDPVNNFNSLVMHLPTHLWGLFTTPEKLECSGKATCSPKGYKEMNKRIRNFIG